MLQTLLLVAYQWAAFIIVNVACYLVLLSDFSTYLSV